MLAVSYLTPSQMRRTQLVADTAARRFAKDCLRTCDPLFGSTFKGLKLLGIRLPEENLREPEGHEQSVSDLAARGQRPATIARRIPLLPSLHESPCHLGLELNSKMDARAAARNMALREENEIWASVPCAQRMHASAGAQEGPTGLWRLYGQHCKLLPFLWEVWRQQQTLQPNLLNAKRAQRTVRLPADPMTSAVLAAHKL